MMSLGNNVSFDSAILKKCSTRGVVVENGKMTHQCERKTVMGKCTFCESWLSHDSLKAGSGLVQQVLGLLHIVQKVDRVRENGYG